MEAQQQRPEGRGPRSHRASPQRGIWADHIEGRFRKITVHQLAMAWWCLQEGHISYRQLRVYFAAHEMAERRRYTARDSSGPGGRRQPTYGIEEIKSLVGGRGSKTADAALRADVKRLGQLGLVVIADHAIDFAVSIEQLGVDDTASFWTMFEQMRHKLRSVPVPRRVLRAMAAGFTRGMTAVAIATMIRSLFWHKSQNAYRVDGRTKREWISEVFGLSKSSVTDARARLIEIGWLVPLETHQILLNRFGTHDQINTGWSPSCGSGGGEGLREAFTASSLRGESDSPRRGISAGSVSPDLNKSLSLTGKLNTRKLRPNGAGPFAGSRREKGGRTQRVRPPGPPNIRSVQLDDLNDTHRMLELHKQAVGLGLSSSSQAGLLDFLCFAERARSRGHKAGALFFWLLKHRKSEFITQSDEDQASRRLRELMDGPSVKPQQRLGGQGQERPEPACELTDDERFVVACTRAASKAKLEDPFHIARASRGWTRERWDTAVEAMQVREFASLRASQCVDDVI